MLDMLLGGDYHDQSGVVVMIYRVLPGADTVALEADRCANFIEQRHWQIDS